jgi:thioesterase domain-containing protein/acyl carrier protein
MVENVLSVASLPRDDPYATVRFMGAVPSAAAELLHMKNGYPDSVRVIILGGEAVSTELVNKLYEQTSVERIIDSYGPTECTYNSTWALRRKNEKPTIGKPLPNTQLFILDKNLQPVPIGIPGEIHLAGDGLAKGYLNREDLTRERFIPNPFSLDENSRLYKTGDLGRFRLDGCVEFLGRLDFQVKLRGFRIELTEIENVLRTHPDVNELVVSVYTDSRNESLLTAWLTVKNKNDMLPNQLREFLRKFLPDYMVPQCFVILDKMPLNANGKIDRKQLPPPLIESKPSSDLSFLQWSLTEEKLKDIWKILLGHDHFGIDDNFFTIGGHSLLGVRMFIELENQYGIRLPLQTLFRAPTIKQLAREIDSSGTAGQWQPVVMFRKGSHKPPLFCLHMHNGNIYRWKILEKFLPDDQPIYAIQPRALDPGQQPQRSVTEQATTYIEEIKKIQPQGPYYLAGLCYGGTVAFEMALQLQARKEKTALCLMVNNYAPLENPTLYRLTKGFERFFKMDFAEKIQYALEKNRRLGRKLKEKTLSKLFGKSSASQAEQLPQQDDIRVIHSLALMAYQPSGKYHGDIFIVRAGGEIEDPQFYDHTLGWNKWVTGKIEVVQIEGSNNDTIIEEEQYSSQLADHIRRKLEELQSLHSMDKT